MQPPLVNTVYIKALDKLRVALHEALEGQQLQGGALLRLAMHDAVTYDQKTNTSGANGSIRCVAALAAHSISRITMASKSLEINSLQLLNDLLAGPSRSWSSRATKAWEQPSKGWWRSKRISPPSATQVKHGNFSSLISKGCQEKRARTVRSNSSVGRCEKNV